MADIRQNGISFNIEDNFLPGESTSGFNGKIHSSNNPYFDLEDGDDISKLVNAVEIDWNGAKPGIGEDENGITTTGELLSSIKGVYSPMFAN